MNITIPRSQVDLFDDAILKNPYPAYAELRDLGPAVWMDAHRAWAIPRYADVRSVLRDHETFSSAPNPGLEPEQPYMPRGDILGSDPPLHEQLRGVLADQLGPRAVRDLRDEISAQADELVAEVVEQRQFDVVSALARRFPVDVVCQLVGLEGGGAEFREKLFAFADAAFNTFGPLNTRTQASLETVMSMLEFMQTAMSRGSLRPGSWGAAIYEAADRGDITHEDAARMMGAFVVAGMDTTVNAISSAIWLLARHIDQWEALRAEPGLAKPAFEETLRLESPAQLFARGVTRDTEIGGTPIAGGDRVVVLFGSANRDERKYPNPETFDIARNPLDHVAFGYGIHVCLGAGLSRIEVPAILESFARRVESVRLLSEPQRHLNNVIRGLKHLPIEIEPAL